MRAWCARTAPPTLYILIAPHAPLTSLAEWCAAGGELAEELGIAEEADFAKAQVNKLEREVEGRGSNRRARDDPENLGLKNLRITN